MSTFNPALQMTKPGVAPSDPIITSDKPLDFSFLNLQNIESLKKEDPRAGKRKPIEESEDEEESKKTDAPANGQENNGTQNVHPGQTDQQHQAPAKEQKETVIRANQTQQITTLLTNFNISLQANKNAGGALGRKNDEGNGKTENKRKKEVKLVCTALFLNNNQIRSIKGLNDVLQFVMFNPSKLEWLDLSYNYLQNIDKELLNFPNLKTLYLHGNYIQNLDEARKLQDLPQLQTLNLYGNFIEQVKGYRLWILGMMYEKHETLKKLDNVLVTRKEFDTVIVWNERLFESQKQKGLRKLKPENIKPVPQKKEEEAKAGPGQAGGH